MNANFGKTANGRINVDGKNYPASVNANFSKTANGEFIVNGEIFPASVNANFGKNFFVIRESDILAIA